MTLELFAGIPVTDYAAALRWYQQLFGSPPAFFPNDIEAVWELAEHRWVYIELRPERAGHAMHTILVDDLDAHLAQIADRGLEPARRASRMASRQSVSTRARRPVRRRNFARLSVAT